MTDLTSKLVAVLALAAAVILGIVAINVAGARNEARRSLDGANRQIAALTADNLTLAANNLTLKDNLSVCRDGLRDQGASIERAAKLARDAQEAGAREVARLEKQNAELGAKNKQLRDLISSEKPETCDAVFDLARRVHGVGVRGTTAAPTNRP